MEKSVMPNGEKAKKGLHSGHRGRMRNRFLRDGLEGFADHEVLELLLFYAVPRQDVNPMAHALLEKFGSLPQVLEASPEELCTIRGIGPKIARFLTLIPDLLIQMEHCLLTPARTPLRSPEDLTAIMTQRDILPAPGETFLIPLDAQYAALAVCPYASFDELDVREIALRTLSINSKLVVLAECVENPDLLPPDPLFKKLTVLQETLAALDIRLVDYYRFDPHCTSPRSATAIGLLLPR